jgi:oligopeptide transport system ATP-binding protein
MMHDEQSSMGEAAGEAPEGAWVGAEGGMSVERSAITGLEGECGREPPVLEVEDLWVRFHAEGRPLQAVGGVSFAVMAGETLAIAGESGSGKSVTAQAIIGLVDIPPGEIAGGDIRFKGQSLLADGGRLVRRLRGREIGMVFQDALAALNPGFSVGYQLAELFRVHEGLPARAAMRRAIELIDRVGIPNAPLRAGDYPHQLSGGMRQRIAIAMAIALDPAVIIADEPTTALDVTVQAQIMELLEQIQAQTGAALIFITHDLGLVAAHADRLAVMYGSRIVELGPARTVFRQPSHPYTIGLIDSVPSRSTGKAELRAIPGQPPDLADLPPGCAFQPRCALSCGRARCIDERPPLRRVSDVQHSACHFIEELAAARTMEVGEHA